MSSKIFDLPVCVFSFIRKCYFPYNRFFLMTVILLSISAKRWTFVYLLTESKFTLLPPPQLKNIHLPGKCFIVNVKQSRYRPGGAQMALGS